MAIYHNTVNSISPKQGHSIVASSSYITAERRVDDRTGETHDYTRKSGVVFHEVLLCDNAPKQFEDPVILWNEVAKVEGCVGRTGKSIEMALPRELSLEEQIRFAREAVKEFYVKDGRCVEYAIHDKGDGNPHIHVITTTRPIDKNGQWEYKTEKVYICKDYKGKTKELSARELRSEICNGFEKQLPYYKNGNLKNTPVYLTNHEHEHSERWKDYERVKGKNDPRKTKNDRENPMCAEWNSEQNLMRWRAFWEERINRELIIKNLPQRVDHRSYEAQGIDKVPTQHLGKSAKQMEQRGNKSERGNLNREIVRLNENVGKAQSEFDIIKRRIEQDNKWNKFHELNATLLKCVSEHSMEETFQRASLEKLAQSEEDINTYLREPDLHKDDYYTFDDTGAKGYRQYHIEKTREDITTIRSFIEKNLAAIKFNIKGQAYTFELHRSIEKDHALDVAVVARRLEAYRAEYIKISMEKSNQSVYKENLIYKQQAMQLSDCTRAIREQTASIESLKVARENLGLFQSREKKAVEGKIKSFELLRAEQLDRLKVLGVNDLSGADEAIKEKTFLAEQERDKFIAARNKKNETSRVNEIKADFHSLVKSVPDEKRQAVLDEMSKIRKQGEKSLSSYQAEISAQRELDSSLKLQIYQGEEIKMVYERIRND